MIIAYLRCKMRRYYTWVMLGDRVKVEMSPYKLEITDYQSTQETI